VSRVVGAWETPPPTPLKGGIDSSELHETSQPFLLVRKHAATARWMSDVDSFRGIVPMPVIQAGPEDFEGR